MKTKKYAPAYMNKMITIAKHIDTFYKISELQDYSYFFEKKSATYNILTPSEIEKLAEKKLSYKKYNFYINKRQKALILLMGTTGCRIGEALNLKFTDIHISPPYVVFRETKNGEDRTVPISQSLSDLLLGLPRKNEFVFPSGRGGKLGLQQVNLDIKKRAIKCGIKKRVWNHLFRHSYITTMLENYIDLLHVAHLVGHKDLRNTSNSSVNFYTDIIHSHPLLKGEISWEQLSRRIRNFISRAVDTRNHCLRTNEKDGKLVIEVEQIK
ncbi:MAG: site-specific integrase [Patescibacteria group bacterium]|nr:site-specific integrase [Patescibacteria group bacterium]